MNIAAFLTKSGPFNVLSPDEIARVAEAAVAVVVPRGERVYSEGERAQRTWIVESGRINISRPSPEGRAVTVEVIGPGDFFGCLGCTAQGRYPCEAVAGLPSVVIGFAIGTIQSLMGRHPGFAQSMYFQMSRRLSEAHQLRSLGPESVEKRVAGVLLWLNAKFGHDLPFTRQSIAEMASTTPESTIRTLGHFRRRGYIDTAWKKIVVQKPLELQELLEQV
jgi:CRP-like cAMP-binding protein